MINFGGGLAFFLGIFLVLCGVALYALRSYRPQLARDHDIFFAAIAAVSGFILMFQGWNLNPILQLGYISVVGSAIFFAVENIRLRGITAEQAKRRPTAVDDDRPVSRTYDYEEDKYAPRDYRYRSEIEERPIVDVQSGTRRIPSSRAPRPAQDEWDDYRDAPRRMPPRRAWRDEAPRYDYDERYDDRAPKRRLPRSPRRNPDPVVVDVSWDDTPRPVRADNRIDGSPVGDRYSNGDDYRGSYDDYRAIPPSSGGGDRAPEDWSPTPPAYNDEAPVVNANYANPRSADGSAPTGAEEEEDNSNYQNLY